MPDIVQQRHQGLMICDVFCGPCCIVIFIVGLTLQITDWVCLDKTSDVWLLVHNATDNTTSKELKLSAGEFGAGPSLVAAVVAALATALVHCSRDRP